MRPRKFLLVTRALTTAGLVAACKKDELPPPPLGNPKGSTAMELPDAGPPLPTASASATPSASASSTPAVPVAATAPTAIPPPGNPKGSGYDTPKAPPPNKPVGNPKGSHYDGGKRKGPPKPGEE